MADSYGKTNLQPGFRLFDGSAINALLTKVLQGGISRTDNITAAASGFKSDATPLVSTFNRVTTAAGANDSVLLPKAIAGSEVTVINSSDQTIRVWAKGGDSISGSTISPDTIATTKAKKYTCVTTGAWYITSAT